MGLVLLLIAVAQLPAGANLRNAKIGDTLAAFELADSTGKSFAYDPGKGRVIVVIFMPTMQEPFEKSLDGMTRVHERLNSRADAYDLVGVISGQSGAELVKKLKTRPGMPILLDTQYKLWGKLGVIATPTAVLAGTDGKIQWIHAGYGYDFIPAMESRILQGLGVEQKEDPAKPTEVKAVGNSTAEARVQRHLQMAHMMEKKGQYEAAVKELAAAREIEPNSVDVRLELGELLCMVGRPADALKLVGNTESLHSDRKARAMTVAGWAYRRLNRLDDAEKTLLAAIPYDPSNARTQFELGKTYQARGLQDKATAAYYRALTILLGDERPMPASQKREE